MMSSEEKSAIEWNEKCIREVKEKIEYPYQDSILHALKHEIPVKAKIYRYWYGVRKGNIMRVACGNCGCELLEAYTKYCPKCGRRIVDGWHIGENCEEAEA